ncbi:MAG: NADH-quinone oxidoreductase subunit N [Candidatus Bathyarchaeia archaeon]|jgi:proton-translocating NADH-quinone oxidoreductase chain N
MFTLPFDLLLIFTVISPIIGWAVPKQYRAKALGVFTAAALAIVGFTLYGLYLDVASAGAIYLPSNTADFATLRVDILGIFMTTIFLGLGAAVAIYSAVYVENSGRTPFYYTLIMTLICGMVGIVFAGDLLMLFVFWELMSISSYALVAFYREEGASVEAGLKFLVMSAAGSATALFGISLIYGMAGTLNFEALTTAFSGAANVWLYIAALFVFLGFGVKAAVFPLHTWLPDAYTAAPAPVSAILAGIVIGPGIFALAKVFFTAFISIQNAWAPMLAVLSVVTMLVGNITALMQTDLKRMLAYSSIGQVGYMLIGLAVGTQMGLTGTFLQFFNHALMKGSAFLCAGAIIYRLGTRELSDMQGVGRKMPLTAFALAIAVAALVGLPPLAGFPGELALFTSAVQADMTWLGVSLILNSVISAGFYLRIVYVLIQPTSSSTAEKVKEAPLLMLLPILALTGLIVLFGVWPDLIFNFARDAANALISLGGAA